jgi:hypothetical protein
MATPGWVTGASTLTSRRTASIPPHSGPRDRSTHAPQRGLKTEISPRKQPKATSRRREVSRREGISKRASDAITRRAAIQTANPRQ